jgi:hypothetical protein
MVHTSLLHLCDITKAIDTEVEVTACVHVNVVPSLTGREASHICTLSAAGGLKEEK